MFEQIFCKERLFLKQRYLLNRGNFSKAEIFPRSRKFYASKGFSKDFSHVLT